VLWKSVCKPRGTLFKCIELLYDERNINKWEICSDKDAITFLNTLPSKW
jgi:hypothetical protein